MSRPFYDWDYDPFRYERMGQLLKKKRQSESDAGFFEMIATLFSVDFLGVDPILIDRMLWSRIALRSPSPIVVNTHESEDELLTFDERAELARMMYWYYKVKWDKQKAVCAIEYDPIHNYLDEWEDESSGSDSRSGTSSTSRSDITNQTVTTDNTRTDDLLQETEEDTDITRTDNLTERTTFGGTSTRTDNLMETKNYGGTSTRTDNLTQTDSGATGTKEHQVQAFNSTQYKPADKEIFTGEGSNTRNNTGTSGTVNGGTDTKANTGTVGTVNGGQDVKANTGTEQTDKGVTGSVANTGTQRNQGSEITNGGLTRTESGTTGETGTNSRERSGRHTGNIGNLTSQKQLNEEIALWKWNFIEELLSDATDFLTLQVYC